MNSFFRTILATQAVKYEKENQEEAGAIALQNQVAHQAQENVNAMKAALASQHTVGSSN